MNRVVPGPRRIVRARRSKRGEAPGFGSIAATGLLAIVAATFSPVATRVAVALQVPEFHAVHFVLDTTPLASPPAEPVEQRGCDVAFADDGTHRCLGRYDATAGTTPFSDSISGAASWQRTAGGPPTVAFGTDGATIFGSIADPASHDLTVTSGEAPWASQLSTPDDPGVPAGEQGGPLRLDVNGMCVTPGTSCGYTFELTGWVLATPPAPVAAPNGQEYFEFNLYLDSRGGFLWTDCELLFWIDHGYGCGGEYQNHRGTIPTTYPWNSGTGDTDLIHFGQQNGTNPMEYFRPGAELDGTFMLSWTNPHQPYHINRSLGPLGSNVHSPDPSATPGEKGGDLSVEISHYQGSGPAFYGFTFDVHGWLLRDAPDAPLGASGSPSPTTLATAPQAIAPTQTVATTQAVTATPSFTG